MEPQESHPMKFTKNELALLAMILNLLESWAQNYLAVEDGERLPEQAIKNFNEDALKLGVMIATLTMEYPDLIEQIDEVLQEIYSLSQELDQANA